MWKGASTENGLQTSMCRKVLVLLRWTPHSQQLNSGNIIFFRQDIFSIEVFTVRSVCPDFCIQFNYQSRLNMAYCHILYKLVTMINWIQSSNRPNWYHLNKIYLYRGIHCFVLHFLSLTNKVSWERPAVVTYYKSTTVTTRRLYKPEFMTNETANSYFPSSR